MRTKLLVAALVGSSAFAVPAFAQDSSFAGSHAEVIAGWDHVSDGSSLDASKDGVTYGGNIGYDFQRGNTVFGVEGEVTGSTVRDHAHDLINTGDRLRTSADRDIYVGGRLGFVVGGRTLVYAKGGYTNAAFTTDYSSPDTSPAIALRERDNLDGWRLGAGIETKVTDKVFVKAEYRYSNYGSQTNGIDPERHQIVTGIGVRF